ncbi:MAG: hypothetical protein ACK559_30580 [bacterium]
MRRPGLRPQTLIGIGPVTNDGDDCGLVSVPHNLLAQQVGDAIDVGSDAGCRFGAHVKGATAQHS